jgi:hypothetical protein
MTKTLDFLEQDYNLRPTPIRAMRDKHQFDYGNAQSPTKRLSVRTPRRRKESSSISENIFLDESPGQQSNVEALGRPQLDKFRSSKLALVDILSWIISACVLIAISIYQLFTRIFRRSSSDLENNVNPLATRVYDGLTNFMSTFYDCMGIAVADLSTAFRNPVASIKSVLLWIHDWSLASYHSLKAFLDNPKIKYHLKNLILSIGLGVLFIALLINFRYPPRINLQPQTVENDSNLKLDRDGCTTEGCLINPVLYKKIELMVKKDTDTEFKNLLDKLKILQMQVDMQQDLIDQQLHSLSLDIQTQVDGNINSKIQTFKQDFEVELDNLKTSKESIIEDNGPDYSLASGGATISSHSPSFYSSSTPYTLLEPSRNPGECWGMKGNSLFYI